jgi:CRP/FNR family cyclic AMP-dependent transcriptional regulator
VQPCADAGDSPWQPAPPSPAPASTVIAQVASANAPTATAIGRLRFFIVSPSWRTVRLTTRCDETADAATPGDAPALRHLAQYVPRVATSASDGLGGFVGALDPDARAALLALGRVRRFPRGAMFIVQGARDDMVGVLLAGSVKVTLDTADGREVVLAVLGPGDLLGEFEALEPEVVSRTASNVALEAIECRVFSAEDLRRFLVAHPAATIELLRLTIRKVHAGDRRRVGATLDTSHRLAHFLVERADADLDIALTQEELASHIASSRESLVRALTALRTRGLIETGRRQIRICDLEGLRAYAG